MNDFRQEEEEKPQKPLYFIFPKFVEQLRSLKLPVVSTLEDDSLTRFMDLAVPESIEKVVTSMVRLKAIDLLGDKKRKEFLIWHESWTGVDKNDNPVPSVIFPKGVDKLARTAKYTDSEGKIKYKQIGIPAIIYTQEFSAKKVDEIINFTQTDAEVIQYSLQGTRSFGGFTYEEFRNLTFEELNERGKKGDAGSPVVKGKKEK